MHRCNLSAIIVAPGEKYELLYLFVVRKCRYIKLELILGQFRHISSHIGMINGQTIERTGKFPIFAGLDGKQTDKLFDE